MKKILRFLVLLFIIFVTIPVSVSAENKVWTGEAAFSFSGGDGTEQNPYQISSGEELALMAKNINLGLEEFSNAHYMLINDIYLNHIINYEYWERNPPVHVWTPIGQLTEETSGKTQKSVSFHGSFDGNGFDIKGMYLLSDNQTNSFCGLFAYCEDGTIKNVNLSESFISGVSASTETYAGGIAGYVGEKGIIDNCNSKVKIQHETTKDNIESTTHIGGIVGSCQGYIRNCKSNSSINVNLYSDESNTVSVGGIAGFTKGITSSLNEGNISGISYNDCNLTLGGIAGSGINIENCSNRGTISNKLSCDCPFFCNWHSTNRLSVPNRWLSSSTGGILGEGDSFVKNCTNYGDVLSGRNSHCTGGILGKAVGDIKIEKCTNYGNITCDLNSSRIGGITGYTEGIIGIADCENQGDITLGMESVLAGGILGDNNDYGIYKSFILNCRNSGKITIGDSCEVIGGIIGSSSLKVDKCINTGLITGGEYTNLVGGINGTNVDGIIRNSTNEGNITLKGNSRYTGGIVGENDVYRAHNNSTIYSPAAQLSNCLNKGNINAKGGFCVGGITGDSYVDVYNCISVGKVIGGTYTGAISGRATLNKFKYWNCFAVSNAAKIRGKSRDGEIPFRTGKELTKTELNSSKTIGILNKWSKEKGKDYLNWEKGKTYPQLIYKK